MKGILALFCGAVVLISAVALAQDAAFNQEADDILDQLVKQEPRYGKTRGFTVPKSRAITVKAKNTSGKEETMTVVVPETSINQGAKLKVEFDVNSSQLRSSAYFILNELITAVQDQQVAGRTVCIKGHTDSDGPENYNLQLSYDRANAVKSYLTGGSGIAANRLQVFGYGEHLPLAPNSTSTNKQLNRRVEVSLDCPEMAATR